MDERISDRTRVVLHYMAAAIDFFEVHRGVTLPRARRMTRKLLDAQQDCASDIGSRIFNDSACAATLHASAFRERCCQVVQQDTPSDHALDQVLAIAIDHACQSCRQLDNPSFKEVSHAR